MSSSGERSVVGALIPVAFLLIASPLADLVAALIPMRPGEVSWRFGAYGLLTNTLVTPIVGLAIITVVSGLQQRHRTAAASAAVCGLLALVLAGGFALFILDYLQLRQAVGTAARGSYDSAAFKAMFVGVLESVVLFWLMVAGFRASGLSEADRARRRRDHVGLVVQIEDQGR